VEVKSPSTANFATNSSHSKRGGVGHSIMDASLSNTFAHHDSTIERVQPPSPLIGGGKKSNYSIESEADKFGLKIMLTGGNNQYR
jgi:hypothetical protein